MTSRVRPTLRLVPLVEISDDTFADLRLDMQSQTLGAFLDALPCLSMDPIDAEAVQQPLSAFAVRRAVAGVAELLYRPASLRVRAVAGGGGVEAAASDGGGEVAGAMGAGATDAGATDVDATAPTSATDGSGRPLRLSEVEAVALAYGAEIDKIGSFLAAGLSVLVYCDKLSVRHLWGPIVRRANVILEGRRARDSSLLLLEALEVKAPDDAGPLGGGIRQRQLRRLRELVEVAKPGHLIVLPHLDLLGAGERNPGNEARELAELLYEAPEQLVLAFVDPSMELPDVLSDRFAVRLSVTGVPREVTGVDGKAALLGDRLVTVDEAALFDGFDARDLFKNVAGLNPLRLRDAIAYAVRDAESRGHTGEKPAKVADLYESIRGFKAQTAEQFEVPRVTFLDIGGYEHAKGLLAEALALMGRGSFRLPDDKLRRELVPKGFLLYGPPGTGKTLFAKAVANQMNATIRVVSGPEVTDKYVGESERKVRAIFADARRNAPAVIVFDEFDAIAAKRTGRDDGGSRAGNALVAQILTEMDGFRPDVPMLVIGTTNRLELIDEALLRPSRFKPIPIPLPDEAARRHIADIHAKHFKVEVTPELLDCLAHATYGFNGDQIRSLFRDACVGLYCRATPEEPTPRRMGELVGRIRAQLAEQRLQAATHGGGQERSAQAAVPAQAASRRQGEMGRVRVSDPSAMVEL